MKIITDITDHQGLQHTIVTTGTFDGVHLGHRKIFEAMKRLSEKTGQKTVVVTFDPHPRIVLKKDPDKLHLLATLQEKKQLIQSLGIDYLVVLPFDIKLSGLSPEDFVCQILIKKLGAQTIFVGYDHQFGKGKSGNKATLKTVSCKYNLEVIEIGALKKQNQIVSSSLIRSYLEKGKVEQAAQLLGYRYKITGKVVAGNKLGRKIGFPTANLELQEKLKLLPGRGVYAVRVFIKSQWHNGMLNIGFRPTLNTTTATVEVHVFDLNANLYNEEITVEFIQFLRNEEKFPDIEALSHQLKRDKIKAQEALYSNDD
ncbi:MAG: bifunctional riboflavin kinase/FAD synthetase [Bacteroidota bacterium]